MKYLYSPQVSDKEINFAFDGEKVTVNLNGEFDEFDFTMLPEGAELTEVETTLPINPIISATRKNGVVEVVLLKFIGADATEEEKFPNWVVV